MLVNDRRRGPALAGEPLAGCADVRQVRRQQLDRDRPVQLAVVRLEHDPHAAAADHTFHVVAAQPTQQLGMTGRREQPTHGRIGQIAADGASGMKREEVSCDDHEASGFQSCSPPPLSATALRPTNGLACQLGQSRLTRGQRSTWAVISMAAGLRSPSASNRSRRQMFASIGLLGHGLRPPMATVRSTSERSSKPVTSSRNLAITRLRAT